MYDIKKNLMLGPFIPIKITVTSAATKITFTTPIKITFTK